MASFIKDFDYQHCLVNTALLCLLWNIKGCLTLKGDMARNVMYDRLHNELDLDVNTDTAGREVLLHTILYGRGITPRNYNLLHEIVYQFLHNTSRFA